MASPHEALGISPVTADRIGHLPARDIAGYVGPWLARIDHPDGQGDPLEALASTNPGGSSLARETGGDLQAMVVELAMRTVRNLLGPDAQIVMAERNG